MKLFEGKYHLWQGDIKYHAIHAKKRGRIALVSGEKAMKEIIESVNGFDAMKRQRDELLASLKALADCISETRGKNADDALHNARAAIAKCEA